MQSAISVEQLAQALSVAIDRGQHSLLPLWQSPLKVAIWANTEERRQLEQLVLTHSRDSDVTLTGQLVSLPRILVAVPCFNGEAQLQVTVPSLLNQSLPAAGIILANDGSTDNSLAVMQSFASQHPQIQIIDLPRGNATKTRNQILSDLPGYDFLCWCDCGDELLPEALWQLVNNALVEQLSGNPKIVILPQREMRFADGRRIINKQPSLGSGLAALKRHLTFLNPFSLHQGGIMSRQALEAVLTHEDHMYDTNQQNGPDFLAGTKLLAYGAKVITLEQVLAIYHIEEQTSELGGHHHKVIARYPDFVAGMSNQARFFDQFVGHDTFKHNAIGSHYFRRAQMLEKAGDSKLADDARRRANELTPWAARVAELAKVCESTDQIVRLYDIFDCSDEPCLVISHFNTQLVLHKHITILRRLLTHGEYENPIIQQALDLIQQYQVTRMFDLGASVGLYAAIIANNTDVLQVYAYEPTPNHFDLLTRTRHINQFGDRMQCFPQAVGSQPGTLPLAISDHFGGANRLVQQAIAGQPLDLPEIHGSDTTIHYDTVTNVPVISLDSEFTFSGETLYLKIDIEGAEWEALAGAQTLLQNNPSILQVEVAPAEQAHFIATLQQLGFHYQGKLHRDLFFFDQRLLG